MNTVIPNQFPSSFFPHNYLSGNFVLFFSLEYWSSCFEGMMDSGVLKYGGRIPIYLEFWPLRSARAKPADWRWG